LVVALKEALTGSRIPNTPGVGAGLTCCDARGLGLVRGGVTSAGHPPLSRPVRLAPLGSPLQVCSPSVSVRFSFQGPRQGRPRGARHAPGGGSALGSRSLGTSRGVVNNCFVGACRFFWAPTASIPGGSFPHGSPVGTRRGSESLCFQVLEGGARAGKAVERRRGDRRSSRETGRPPRGFLGERGRGT
jgi:hypothetical protein